MYFVRVAMWTIEVQERTHDYWSYQLQAIKTLKRRSQNSLLQDEGMTMSFSFVLEYSDIRQTKRI